MNVYSVLYTSDLINNLVQNHNYELVQLREGILGVGDCVLLSPDENYYHYIIKEKYKNEWSSVQTIRRCKKLSKKMQIEIEKAIDNIDKE